MTASTWLLLTRYVRPMPEVDALRADHVAHLERQRDAGRFVAWGRLVPPTGGFIGGNEAGDRCRPSAPSVRADAAGRHSVR